MRIETKRLIIREFQECDYEDAFKYLSNPIVMKYVEPIFNMVQTKKFINKYGIQEKIVFAVEEKTSRKVVGHVIFHEYNNKSEYEIGWIFNSEFHGKGYAKEASIALFDYGFNTLKLKRIIAETDANNQKSISVIKSLGMNNIETHQGRLSVWVINKDDYKVMDWR